VIANALGLRACSGPARARHGHMGDGQAGHSAVPALGGRLRLGALPLRRRVIVTEFGPQLALVTGNAEVEQATCTSMPISFMSGFESLATFYRRDFSWAKGCAPDLRSHDEGGSFAAGRARKSLSLSCRFRNSSMENPAETEMLQDSVVRPITGLPARRTYC
jgi:hypothetical protein